MENKKYLNEETYQENKKKITRLAVIVLIVGVLIGIGLIITGAVLSHNAQGININLTSKEEKDAEENVVQREESEIQEDINNVKPKISSLESEVMMLEAELSLLNLTEGYSDKYYEKKNEIETKETELLNLKVELEKYQKELKEVQGDYSTSFEENLDGLGTFENIFNSASDKISKSKYYPFYMFGAFIIIASCMISGSIYMFAKRREITAFTAQQVMPVAKEGIDEMAPTIGNVAKEISKGIKEGTKNNTDK